MNRADDMGHSAFGAELEGVVMVGRNLVRAVLRVLGWATVAALAAGLIAVVVLAFGPLPARILGDSTAALQPVDRIKAEADIRSAMLQAVAGALLVVGAITAWRQMLVNRGQQRVGRRTATTEAFAKAVELLGDDKAIALRIGGVYALDRVAGYEPEEAARVADILIAHVRGSLPAGQTPAPDVRAAVSILVSRRWPVPLDFAGLDLTGHHLSGAAMCGARLAGAHLPGVSLARADLREADLTESNLRGADLSGADLRGADLTGATFSGAASSSATRWPQHFVPEDHGIRSS